MFCDRRTLRTPPRGTRFNYLALGTVGTIVTVRRGLDLMAGARLVHVSSVAVYGPGGRYMGPSFASTRLTPSDSSASASTRRSPRDGMGLRAGCPELFVSAFAREKLAAGRRDVSLLRGWREDVVGNLYPDSLTSEVDVAQSPSEFPRTSDRGNESVIDPHARFNGKYVSDRDLRFAHPPVWLEDAEAMRSAVLPFVFRRYLDYGVIDAIRKQFEEEGYEDLVMGSGVVPYLYLPYFSNLTSRDVMEVRQEEQDHYIDFQRLLTRLLSGMDDIDSEKKLLDHLREVDDGVRKLVRSYEAIQKADRRRDMATLMGFVAVGLLMLLLWATAYLLTFPEFSVTGMRSDFTPHSWRRSFAG